MLETPGVVQSSAQPAAVLHLAVPRARIQEVMGPGLQEIHATLREQGIAPAGAWFTHHLRMDPNTFDYEIGVPVATPVEPHGRVRPGALPATTVARAVYVGDYSGLPGAWSELMGWIHAHGYAEGEDLWEVYAVGPDDSPEPGAWRTELNRPVTKA